MIYLAIFAVAALNEIAIAAWTQAVASRLRGRAVGLTIALELVRLPALLLITSQPLGSPEQMVRAGIAMLGYATGTFILLTLEKKQ